MSLDVLIEGARIIDGTGSPWFEGCIGIEEERISHVKRGTSHDLTASCEVEAEGKVVCPGFIDLHSHADLEPFTDPTITPKITQGVTTEIVGQDGFSMAPTCSDANLDSWWRFLGGFYPNISDRRTWPSIADYLDAIDKNGAGANIATLVGHGTIRANVMGMDNRKPSDDELQKMQEMVSNAIENGAVGFSTGLDYTPQCYAATEEIQQLAGQLASSGLPFVAHIRSYRDKMWNALDEFVDIGESEGIPVHLSHFKLGGAKRGLSERALHIVRSARERDIDFTADVYPFVPGSGNLFTLLPRRYHSMTGAELRASLKDEETRTELIQSLSEGVGPWNLNWKNVLLCHVDSEDSEDVLGKTILEAASERNQHPALLVCDILLKNEFKVGIVNLSEQKETTEQDIRSVLSDDLVGIGSDGMFGKKPHPRTYGTYPRILGHYVRDTNLLSIEEAVRKMTSLPSRIFHLQNKGIVRPGFDADLVMFNPETISSSATVDQPTRTANGIDSVLVNGVFVVRDSAVTNRTPGRALRS
ncbi:N-acyl-D-amino-acid deacylase family protein [Halorarum salinum]|uniref:Amidohydrolase family protein n=1 Tax=Halorarum salinum TaxID=2743089 RepID=A0A7D5L9D4_9EURY|nr:amidohydrolase family protein [Halobaculum salinum]QLG61047.1 amidohydrolase family protein [Halobaculum salinum]